MPAFLLRDIYITRIRSHGTSDILADDRCIHGVMHHLPHRITGLLQCRGLLMCDMDNVELVTEQQRAEHRTP